MKSVLFPFYKKWTVGKKNFHGITWIYFFLPLTKHDRNSLNGPTALVLSYLLGLSVLSLHPYSFYPFPSQSGWHLLCRVVGAQLPIRAGGTFFMFVSGCCTRWMTSPAQGLRTQSLSLPARAFLPQESQCQLFAIRSRAELQQKPWCPGGSRKAVLMASKENSGASSPPARLYSVPKNHLKNISKVSDPIYELV